MPEKVWTTLEVLEWTADRFSRAGIASARLDAQVLLAHALSCNRVQLYTRHDRQLEPDELHTYRDLVRRRLAGQPVAYLIGEQEFWSLPFHVDPAVLIPRRDTETVIEVILDALDTLGDALSTPSMAARMGEELGEPGPHESAASDPGAWADSGELIYVMDESPYASLANQPGLAGDQPAAAQGVEEPPRSEAMGERGGRVKRAEKVARLAEFRIADIATGSGAIAVTLAYELPNARIVATDISERAIRVTERNAQRNQVGDRVHGRIGDLFAPIDEGERFDIIASNPPYIPSQAIAGLSAEIGCEPRLALDGGSDGLTILGRLITLAPRYLGPRGLLVIEHGHDQAEAVARLFAATGAFEPAALRHDLSGNPRVTYARKASHYLPDGPEGKNTGASLRTE